MLASPSIRVTQFDAVLLRGAGQKLVVIHGTFSVAAMRVAA
jgi:hypothetical protein